MKSIKFKEVNCTIAESQDGFGTIYSHWKPYNPKEIKGIGEHIMRFKLNDKEIKQVLETGEIWLRRETNLGVGFQPVGIDVLKPEDFE